jgi:CheY-like chemotaxis protein
MQRENAVGRERVLVADDDPEMIAMVSRVLSRLGLDVVTAASGDELLDKVAEQSPFDLVVTDVSMPWMSGLQVMHTARAAGIRSPVIVITALRDHRTADQVDTLGSQVVRLNKPFSVAELETAVRALLQNPPVSH